MDSNQIHLEMVGRTATETIILRDERKNLVEYEDTDDTKCMRSNIEIINEAIQKRRIRLYCTNLELRKIQSEMKRDPERAPLDFNAVTLHRFFSNSSFEQGGRFYGGWWQSVPSKARQNIHIDHKGTQEIDYSGMHIRMLYGRVGLESPDDPYDLPVTDFLRSHQKRAISILINAESFPSGVKTIYSKLRIKNPRELAHAMMKRHHPISEFFGSGIGVKLQYQDSQIAELVMLKIISLGGIALPLHDSFIVRVGREGELAVAMDEAFRQIIENVDPIFKLKENYLSINPELRDEDDLEFVSDELSNDDLERAMNE